MNILHEFDFKCPLTGSEDISLEHFVPLSIGHGGTTYENCYPMDISLNSQKSYLNPFEWIKREDIRGKVNIVKWNELVNRIAELNGLSIDEYKEYVYWCFRNKRDLEEINDNKDSIRLWLEEESK